MFGEVFWEGIVSVRQAAGELHELNEAVDPADTRALILHTAMELFLKHGYAAVSINQIIEEVSRVRKLTKPTIYYYFADKEALFVAVLLESMEQRGRQITAASQTGGDLATRVAALAWALRGGHNFMVTLRSALSELQEDSREQFMRARHANIFAPLVAAFEQFAAQGDLRPGITPSVAATALVGLSHTLSFSDALTGIDIDVATLTAEILLNGIAAHEREERGPPVVAPGV